MTGIEYACYSLQQLLQHWWSAKTNNAAHKILLQATPIFICWNLWKNRCACKYGGKTTNISRVKYAIYKDSHKRLSIAFPHINWPAKWTDLIQKCESCVQDTKVSLVAWNKHSYQLIKVNINGSALANPGSHGDGGILRDKNGQLLMAFAATLCEGTNNKAEIEAAIFCLSWTLELGYSNILLDLDSPLVVEWINQQPTPQWNLIIQLGRLQNLIRQTQNFKCTHVYREKNWVADALSKHNHQTTNP
ncbi:uncharacterized protein LOC107001123 [Solanum pennellii]|uniref:Uncharacterized protein LOC107001123 n=1 Tax=Solanum pennellii TaxID=28526 RepID=A0ABM1FC94_SOLPN|nr:uncharacterized protein LOC107001123 [Solanum pennellii]